MQLSRPISVFLNITNDCNLACKYCSSPKINKGQLTDEQLLALMVELAEFGVFRLILTGGEPLVHPLTLDIIHQYSARFSFTVNTNGSLVDSCVAALLRKNNVKVNLSLDHFDPAKNDSVRGGTVSAIAGLRHLVDAGVDVTLLVTVSRVNQYDIRDICAWAFEQGVKRVSFNPIISIGKAEKAPHLILDIDDNLLLVETFSAVLAEYPNVSAEYWLAAVELLRRFKQADMSTRAKIMQCGVAHSQIAITSTGDVLPCNKIDLVLGNINVAGLIEIWSSPTVHKLRQIKRKTTDDIDGCRKCMLAAFCGGGCRGDAWISCQNLLGANKLCWYPQYIMLAEARR